jgi:hypothetical protein
MSINTENTRWADTESNDPVTGVANRVAPSEGIKTEGVLREEPLARPHVNYQFNAIHESLLEVQNQIDNLVQGSGESLLGLIYHVGSIYLSLSPQDPAERFGIGTWSRIAGKTLIGFDSSDTDFDGAGGSGGNKNHAHSNTLSVDGHVLTVAELASHSHDYQDAYYVENSSRLNAASKKTAAPSENAGVGSQGTDNDNNQLLYRDANTATIGSNQAHSHNMSGSISAASNLPPYLTVFMWKRIS